MPRVRKTTARGAQPGPGTTGTAQTDSDLAKDNAKLRKELDDMRAAGGGRPGLGLPLGAPLSAAMPRVFQPHAVDLKDYKNGKGYKSKSGEEFGLRVVEDDPHGRTHKLKNEEHFWEGTEADFKKEFEKV